jgi:hypothetical protein
LISGLEQRQVSLNIVAMHRSVGATVIEPAQSRSAKTEA